MSRGYSLIDLLAAMTLAMIMCGIAVPLVFSGLDRARAGGAARYVASQLMLARFEAINRSAFVAVRFLERPDGYWLRSYVDGNRNGVLTQDITQGIDRPIGPERRLDQQFPGIGFGICPNVPSITTGEPANPSDPIQIGASNLMSFNPNGSSTSGTLYIRGTCANQLAVRVAGATARARLYRFEFPDGKWRFQ